MRLADAIVLVAFVVLFVAADLEIVRRSGAAILLVALIGIPLGLLGWARWRLP
jgi:cbb3-type cytochrome oxidase subunit 3